MKKVAVLVFLGMLLVPTFWYEATGSVTAVLVVAGEIALIAIVGGLLLITARLRRAAQAALVEHRVLEEAELVTE